MCACVHTGLAEEKPQLELDNEGEEEQTEPIEVPETFLLAEAGDHNKALARYLDTQKWRKEIGADSALATPHPKFDICKVNKDYETHWLFKVVETSCRQYYLCNSRQGHTLLCF
jgi:hypothetical protein